MQRFFEILIDKGRWKLMSKFNLIAAPDDPHAVHTAAEDVNVAVKAVAKEYGISESNSLSQLLKTPQGRGLWEKRRRYLLSESQAGEKGLRTRSDGKPPGYCGH